MVVDSLQQDAKLGKGDEVAVLQRERKKRIEAADGLPDANRASKLLRALRAELIEHTCHSSIREEWPLVDEAVAETGASEQSRWGQVMSALGCEVGGRADGKRVSAAVRSGLARRH